MTKNVDHLTEENFTVNLPCTPETFAQFVNNLLGKPQTARRRIFILFDIDMDDVASLHHLLMHRINEQNDATLVQFSAILLYNNSSSVRLNSFDEFQQFNEIRNVICTGVEMSWIFLFEDRSTKIPSKQEIRITFGNTEKEKYETIDDTFSYTPSVITIEIHYTVRSWAVDIENLFANYIKKWARRPNPVIRFLNHYDVPITLFFSFFFGLFSFFHSVNIGRKIIEERVDLNDLSRASAISGHSGHSGHSGQLAGESIELIVSRITEILLVYGPMLTVTSISIAVLSSIVFGIIIGSILSNMKYSSIIRLRDKQDDRRKIERFSKWSIVSFVVSVGVAIICSISASAMYGFLVD